MLEWKERAEKSLPVAKKELDVYVMLPEVQQTGLETNAGELKYSASEVVHIFVENPLNLNVFHAVRESHEMLVNSSIKQMQKWNNKQKKYLALCYVFFHFSWGCINNTFNIVYNS